MKTVTLIGSMKFNTEMDQIQNNLYRLGYKVLRPRPSTRPIDELLELSKKRIRESDSVLVVNIDNYIGITTNEEIEYAKSINKPIEYLIPEDEYHVITLIGSSKFQDIFKEAELKLTRAGYIVLTPSVFNEPDISALTEEQHRMYDYMHERKMLRSEFVVVISKNYYVGTNTSKEIEYCTVRGIPVKYWEEIENEYNND